MESIREANKRGYQLTKIGLIPKDWNWNYIKYLSTKVTDGEHSTPERCGSGYYLLSARNIQDGYISVEDVDFIPENEYLRIIKRCYPEENDILLSCSGTIGRVTAVPSNFECGMVRSAALIKPDHSIIDYKYMMYSLQDCYVQVQILKSLNQGAQANLFINHIEKLKICLPPLPEQRAIAHVLSLMDTAINTNDQLITQKELRKKWLMQNLLTGKKRLKGFSDEWNEYHLGDMFSERNERNTNGSTLLSIGQNGVYPQDESIKKDTSNADKSKYKRICKGDIGYNTMRMWQGRSALSELEGIVSPAYTILKPRQNADSLFFSYLFKTPKLINLFWRNSQGLVDDTLNCKYKDFSIIKAILPNKAEQIAIAQVLQAADKEIQLLKTKTEKLREQKKGMMQVLLTGKKRLKVENN